MPNPLFKADPTRPYKAIYAAVMAGLTAASAIWVNHPGLTIALATVGAIGVYVMPNPVVRVDASDDREAS